RRLEDLFTGGRPVPALEVEAAPTSDDDVARLKELQTKADLTEEGGVLVSSQLPNLAITQTFVVEDEDERLALDVEEGDVAIQEDNETTYIHTGGDPSNNENWSVIVFDVVGAIASEPIEPANVLTSRIDFEQPTEPVIEDSAGASYDIDVSDASVYDLVLEDDTEFSFTGEEADRVNSVTVYLEQDSSGDRSPAWPSNVIWPEGLEPGWSADSGEVDVVSFTYRPRSG
ncbi:hypothetical protein, partial [Cryptosporangium minutisporangium]|uniref:hypothetical protein n=1 Tax=Cryptosporangium minutisporangium TaxID=113569 RepID=UPI0035E95538